MSEHRDIGRYVEAYFRLQGDLAGKIVVDLPAGKGRMSRALREMGATVEPYDLYPEYFEVEGMACRFADLERELPIAGSHADYAVFQEGLEHLPDQLRPLREFNRILKPRGRLLLTTPNPSSLRARLCHFLVEGYLFNRLPINEASAIRMLDRPRGRYYFGHVFLIGAQRLRLLARIAGFRLAGIHPNRLSAFSVLLGVVYPVLLACNALACQGSRRRYRRLDPDWLRPALRDVVALNLHPRILFAKKLFFELEKIREPDEAGAEMAEHARR
ncbi:MAG: class I SAM-dependent methyltransferase [Verrucomicrobia bacterium]|nr:class I SAM-dependent methyltransferase [Verrucomicrobiota bacterium]